MTREEFSESIAKVLNTIQDAIEKFGLTVIGYDDTGEFPTVLLDCKEDDEEGV